MPYASRTAVPVDRTRAEIERLLAKYRASQYGTAVDYEKLTARVQFKLAARIVRFDVVLPDAKKFRGDRLAQEERRIWRALLLVIRAKLEAVASGITTFDEEFLAHVVLPNDQTVGRMMQPIIEGTYQTGRMPQLLLGDGGA